MTSLVEKFDNFETSNKVKDIIDDEDNDVCDICMIRPINKNIKCNQCAKCICALCLNRMKNLKFNRDDMLNGKIALEAVFSCPYCRCEGNKFKYTNLKQNELNIYINTDYNRFFKICKNGDMFEEKYEELLMKQMKIENIVNKSDDELINYLIEENINKGNLFNELYETNLNNENKIDELNNNIKFVVLKHKDLTLSNKLLIEEQKRLIEENRRIVEFNKKIVEEHKRIVDINNTLSSKAEELLNGNKQNLENMQKIRNVLDFKEKPHITIKNLKNLFKNLNFSKHNGNLITTDNFIEY